MPRAPPSGFRSGSSRWFAAGDFEPAHHLLQSESRQTEELGGFRLVALRLVERFAEEIGFEGVDARAQIEADFARALAAKELWRQIRGIDHGLVAAFGRRAHDERAAHLVLELAHVAGPREVDETIHRGFRHAN